MGIIEIILIGIGLSMDAFAVSVCKGLSVKENKIGYPLLLGGFFGGFQALMPTVGYFLGAGFEKYITAFDHWIAFGLLAVIGGNMLREAISGGNEEENDDFSLKTLLVLAVATSIDALAVGISFAFLDVNIALSALLIAITTFVFSFGGYYAGRFFGSKYEKISGILGGAVLILTGVKILLEHLGVISF